MSAEHVSGLGESAAQCWAQHVVPRNRAHEGGPRMPTQQEAGGPGLLTLLAEEALVLYVPAVIHLCRVRDSDCRDLSRRD